MIIKGNKGFTFLELLIVISILFIVLTFVYTPYSHYQEKIKMKQVVREVAQGIYEARSMSMNGFDEKNFSGKFENKSVGLYLNSKGDDKNYMYFLSYPHDTDKSAIGYEEGRDINIIKSRKLPTGTQFDFAGIEDKNILFFFEAITGKGYYFSWDKNGIRDEYAENSDIVLNFSYKGSDSSILMKQLKYNTMINIVDY